MAASTGGKRKPYTVSLFGQLALAGAVIVYLFSMTFDPAEEAHFFTMLLLLIAGVVLSIFLVGVKVIPFNTKSLLTDLLSTGITFGAMFLLSSLLGSSASTSTIGTGTSPIGPISFGILSGVAEGWFFHMFLVGWLSDIATPFIGIPGSALCWAIFHLDRYGFGPFFWIIFMVGLPLGALTVYFRSNDGSTFGHMLANALVGRV